MITVNKKLNLLIFILILGIACIHSLSIAEEWKTYKNNDYEYVIKYPADWNLIEAKPRGTNEAAWAGNILMDREVQKITFQEKNYGIWQAEFQLRILPNPNNLSIDKWIQENEPQDITGGSLVQGVSDIKVDGKPAKRLSVFGFDCEQIAIDLIYKGFVYEFCFVGNNPNDPESVRHQEAYSGILSSFKFSK